MSLPLALPLAATRASGRPTAWPWLLALWALVLAGMAATGLTFSAGDARRLAAGLTLFGCVAMGAHVYRRMGRGVGADRIAGAADGLVQLLLASLGVCLLVYVAIAVSWPLADPWLARADLALGFSCRRWSAGVSRVPGAARVMTFAYESLNWQVPLAAVALGATGRAPRFVRAMLLAGVITSVGSVFAPAVGCMPAGAYLAHTYGLKAGTLTVIPLQQLEGLATFPSFHTAAGVLLTLAAREVRWLFRAAVVLNTLMVVSTLTDGAHYLVDVIAGVTLAFGAAYLTGLGRRESLEA